MRVRTALVAALLAGISVACSKPGSNDNQTDDASTYAGDREIRLVDAPSPDAPVVSALEAGLNSRLTVGNSTLRSTGPSRMVATAASPEAGDLAPGAEAAEPTLALTEMTAPDLLVAPTTSLPARVPGTGMPASAGGRHGTSDGSGAAPSGGTRGPVILIRGGMGTPHDDCKLHPVASRAIGIAINNVAPPIPGRVAVNNRLPRGNGGFTRIR